MRSALLKTCIIISVLCCFSGRLSAQINTGINGSVINLPCAQNCITQAFRIPHLKTTSDYVVNGIPYTPYPFVTAAAPLVFPCGNQDDKYFDVTTMPFDFCFYDSVVNKLVISTNGSLTFDISNALRGANWTLNPSIVLPYRGNGDQGGGACPQPDNAPLLPRAGIFGVFCDLLPGQNDAVYKIEARAEGTAPWRRFVVSFSQLAMYGNCTNERMSSQIVLYESTGIVEIFIDNKPPCNANNGLSLVGMQNFEPGTFQAKGITAPGRGANNGAWAVNDEGWRFTPSGGLSRFVNCQLLDMTGATISTGDTITTTKGILDVTFPNFCQTTATAQYVIKTTYSACDNINSQLTVLDTITVNKTTSLDATVAVTPTNCGLAGTGTATVTVPAGVGTQPFTYLLTPGNVSQPSNQFTGLTANSYNITVTDAAGCSSALQADIVSTGMLAVTYNVTNTSCAGAANGSITVNPPNGTPPIEYSLNGSAYSTNNVFSNLPPGNHLVMTQDAAGCSKVDVVIVSAGPPLTITTTSTPSSCPGAANGSITVTSVSGNGTQPYQYSINNGPWQPGNSFPGLLGSASPYSISVKDAIGCTVSSVPVVVAVGTGTVTGTAIASPTACAGVNNGSVTVTATSGNGPYEYSINNGNTWQTSNIFTGLAPNTYNFVIREASQCISQPIPATVTAGNAIQATVTTTATSCTGANNGSILVTPANGTAPFTFLLDGTVTQSGATATFTGVSANTHNISITDANGCTTATAIQATVTAGSGFTATYTSINSTCPGALNGSITVTPNGGTGPFTFKLGTVTQVGNTNSTFNNLASGSYNILITDAVGCQFTLNNATITASAGFTATYTAINTTCSGAANGTLTVTPGAGGTAPYTFVLGAVSQTGNANTTFTNLASGNYNILVTDANSCQYTVANAAVLAGPPLNVPVTSVSTTCPGVNNGTITATPSNGNGPYTFVLDGTVSQTAPVTTTFAGVASGNHAMLVTDANGCSINIPAISINSGAGITAAVNSISTSCSGANNGSIAITPSNGTGPFTFVLNGTTTQTGATSTTFGNLAAGALYSIVVTDAIGCTGTFNNISVPQGAALQVNTIPTSTSCNTAANGQILVQPTNGGGPYTFVLSGPASATQTGNLNTTFTGLAANTYNLTITDAAGCVTGPIPATVNPGPAISVSPVKTDATCFGLPTGSINATASGNATAPVEYSLNNTNWQTNPGFSGLAANAYTVYVRDALGCTNSAVITVGQPTQLTAAPAVQNVSCNGLADGRLTINAGGGTPAYTYSLNNTTFQASGAFNVPAGTYTGYVRDANNCIASLPNIVIAEPAPLTATAITASATCDGGADGSITVTANGGVAPYQYAVTGGTFQPGASLSSAPGTYTVTVRDANSCSVETTPVVVALTNNLSLAPTVDPAPICEGTGTQLQLNTNATQFAWTPATGLTSATEMNPIASPGVTTPYHVIVTLGRCSLDADIVVNVMPAPVANGGTDPSICYGQSTQLQAVGDPSFTYSWTPATYLDTTKGPIVNVILPRAPVTYQLTVTDANGCQSLQPDDVVVDVTPPIKVNLSPADTIVYAGAGVQVPLAASSIATKYQWSPATGLDNPNIPNPTATAPGVVGALVTYHVVASTAAGCRGEADVTIKVFKGPEIYVANAFSPNNDGRNDQFMPFPVGIKQINYFRVFNRWGQTVYSGTQLNKGWDGKLGGIDQPSGIYTWVAEGVTMDNQKITKKGTVMLIR